ncbi:hypothetical protein ACOSP7_006583 [Xanthoceras sorbifolium]
MLFVKNSKTKVYQPGYRFSIDKLRFYDFLFLFLSLSLSPFLSFFLSSSSSSSSSSFFFFLLSLGLSSLFSSLSVLWLLGKLNFFLYFSVVATCGRGTHWSFSTAFIASTPRGTMVTLVVALLTARI